MDHKIVKACIAARLRRGRHSSGGHRKPMRRNGSSCNTLWVNGALRQTGLHLHAVVRERDLTLTRASSCGGGRDALDAGSFVGV